jgi:hypothetical protein
VREKGGELERGLKQGLEPVVGAGLEGTSELEHTQLAVLLPHGDPQRRTQGGRQEAKPPPPVELPESAVFGGGRESG